MAKIVFDPLDIKVLSELPLIAEVLVSTGNKIARSFAPLFEDLKEVCMNHTPKGWVIEKKQLNNVIYPFASEYGKDTITELENHFGISTGITFVKKSGTKWISTFWILFGLYWNAEDPRGQPYLYFQVECDPKFRNQGVMFPLSFYQSLVPKNQRLVKTEIKHTERGSDEELIALTMGIENVSQFGEAYEVFKNSVVLPYLKAVSINKKI